MQVARALSPYHAPRARAELGAAFLKYAGPVLLGALIIALPVLLHMVSQTLAIVVCVLLALILANFAAQTLPVVLLVSYVLQNFFVALLSPLIETVDDLDPIRAYNFLLTAVVWVVLIAAYWLERRNFDRRMRRLIDITSAAIALICVYFVIGLASDPAGAAVYFRNIATPFMLFQIFALVAYRYRIELMGPLMLIGLVSLLYGYVELFNQEQLHRLVNGDAYLMLGLRERFDAGVFVQEMHETGRVMRSYLDHMVIEFLNTPFFAEWGFKLTRVVGPNFHPISYAYLLATLAIILAATGRWWFAVIALPMIVAIGSKGALALLAITGLALFMVSCFPALRRLWIFVLLLACYAAAGIVTGINAQDYHVIGFIGGLRGFLSDPLGHGIGSGGNLSMNMANLDWSRSQGVGHTAVAVESAIGVLLYQVGIAGVALLGVLAWIGTKLWGLYRASLSPVFAATAVALTTILVNGIFQEEALFAPLALGLLAGLSGLLLGSVQRERLRSYSQMTG